MFAKSSRHLVDEKKKEILRLLKEGKLVTTTEAPSSSNSEFWSILLRIRSSNDTGTFEPFVQCSLCDQVLSYDSKNGTRSLSHHAQSCSKKTAASKSTLSIEKYMKKNVIISPEDKQMITLACSKYCAFDMRSFNSVKGDGFRQLCQELINVGYKYGGLKAQIPSAESILPDPTNISRRIQHLSAEYRVKLINIFKEDLKHVKLLGISSDYWKNSLTSDYYLTVNLHYTKGAKPVTFMLDTSIFYWIENWGSYCSSDQKYSLFLWY